MVATVVLTSVALIVEYFEERLHLEVISVWGEGDGNKKNRNGKNLWLAVLSYCAWVYQQVTEWVAMFLCFNNFTSIFKVGWGEKKIKCEPKWWLKKYEAYCYVFAVSAHLMTEKMNLNANC